MRRTINWVYLLLLSFSAFSLYAAEQYELGPGDSVRITVYNNPDLTTETRVTEDGSIPFPLLGHVKIGGLTKTSSEELIGKSLVDRGFLRQAEVNVTVTDFRSQQVSVLGEVKNPGKYAISQATTITEILAQAGGITDKGSPVVRVVQHNRAGVASERDIDLKRLVTANGNVADLTVHNGDVIFVDAQPMFYIYGEVQHPGAYPLQREMTVRQAIAIGGGLTVRGTERGIKVSRRNTSGAIEVHHIKLNDSVMAGDVLQIKESLF